MLVVVFPKTLKVPAPLADCNLPCSTFTFPFTVKVPVVRALNIPVPPVAPAVITKLP